MSYKLIEILLSRSDHKVWEHARMEWVLDHIDYLEDGEPMDHCLCEHEIRELCFIRNACTGQMAMIGNCCVKQFLPIDTATIFDGLRRIRRDMNKAPGDGLVRYASERGILNEWETKFSTDTRRKRKLSERQRTCRYSINQKILRGIGV